MNPTEFCKVVENRLGWRPPDLGWRSYIPAARVVRRKIASNPRLYTWENLLLAVELLAREKQPRSPAGVFAHVERALERKREDDSDVEKRIQHAVGIEAGRGDPEGWGVRFARAMGPFRLELIEEWESRHGSHSRS